MPCSIWSTASRTRAHLAAERKKLSQILAKVAAGALPISVGIFRLVEGVPYGELLSLREFVWYNNNHWNTFRIHGGF